MMRSFVAAAYCTLGLLSGLFFREFTKANDWPTTEFSQLNVLHTHLLTLGMMVVLIVLALDAVFPLSGRTAFDVFFWVYHTGVLLTIAVMVVHGALTVTGTRETDISPAVAGIAGLGHIAITGGIIAFFVALAPAVRQKAAERYAAQANGRPATVPPPAG